MHSICGVDYSLIIAGTISVGENCMAKRKKESPRKADGRCMHSFKETLLLASSVGSIQIDRTPRIQRSSWDNEYVVNPFFLNCRLFADSAPIVIPYAIRRRSSMRKIDDVAIENERCKYNRLECIYVLCAAILSIL